MQSPEILNLPVPYGPQRPKLHKHCCIDISIPPLPKPCPYVAIARPAICYVYSVSASFHTLTVASFFFFFFFFFFFL